MCRGLFNQVHLSGYIGKDNVGCQKSTKVCLKPIKEYDIGELIQYYINNTDLSHNFIVQPKIRENAIDDAIKICFSLNSLHYSQEETINN